MTKNELFKTVGCEGHELLVICSDVYERADVLVFLQEVVQERISPFLLKENFLMPELCKDKEYLNVVIYRGQSTDCTKRSKPKTNSGLAVTFPDFAKLFGIGGSGQEPESYELPDLGLLFS